MSTDATRVDWREANDEYLHAALTWLRLRLRRLAEAVNDQTVNDQAADDRTLNDRAGWANGPWGGRRDTPAGGGRRVTGADVEKAAAAMDKAARIEPRPALFDLAERLALSRFEQDILLLCAALELDTRIAALCARAQGDDRRAYPTFALAMALFDDPGWEAMSADRPLRHWRLIEIHQAGAQALTASPLRADERIVNYIKGCNSLDDRLAPLLVAFDYHGDLAGQLPESQRALAAAIAASLEEREASGRAPILQLVGSDPLSKQLVALAALHERALLARMPLDLLPAQSSELETIARLWQRESMLLPLVLYIDAHEASGAPDGGAGGQPSTLRRLLARDLGLVVLDTREIQPGLGPYSVPIDVDRPAPSEQQEAWIQALGPGSEGTAAQLAGQFNLNLPTIQRVAYSVTSGLPEGDVPAADAVWQACLAQTRPRLDKLAQRLEPKATWRDIVLPAEPEELLHQIAGQVRQRSKVYDDWGFRRKMNRGLGISALFSGESGTGKTMAAEVIANELELNLYRIDLSAVVSKYIGETEKNLRQVFDAAEDGGAILFFDEADALFGKRSEVKDSHDRYANIEVNYLLQRMEAYSGLAILATNMRDALDTAFLRRLRFIVTFPFPDVTLREQIWRKVFPAPAGGQPTIVEWPDYAVLADLPLTGGSIHNTALNAAFLAAQAGTPVTMPLLFQAALNELRKLERPISQASFRQPVVVRDRAGAWSRLLAGAAAVDGARIDTERLGWWDMDEREREQVAAHAMRATRAADVPLTTEHLAAAVASLGERAPIAAAAAVAVEETVPGAQRRESGEGGAPRGGKSPAMEAVEVVDP